MDQRHVGLTRVPVWLIVAMCLCPWLASYAQPEPENDPAPPETVPARVPEPNPASSRVLNADQKRQVLDTLVFVVERRAFAAGVDFSTLSDKLKARAEALDAAPNDAAFAREIGRALKEYEISHFRVMTPTSAGRRREGAAVGVGVAVRKHDDGLIIMNVMEDGPAALAGIEEGDIILAIDGREPESTESLAGEAGSEVWLRIRAASGAEREVSLTRREYSLRKPESLTPVGDDACVLRIPSFGVSYDRAKVESMVQQASERPLLIIDLRGNGGGTVSNVLHFAGMFLAAGTEIGTSVSKELARRFARETDGDPTDARAIAEWTTQRMKVRRNPVALYKGALAVLIDRASGSGSEITAVAMRELRQAPLIGEPSGGAVLVASYVRLAHGFEVQVPVSDYVSIGGVRIEGAPIQPDVEAPRPRKGEEDLGVARALEAIRARAEVDPEIAPAKP